MTQADLSAIFLTIIEERFPAGSENESATDAALQHVGTELLRRASEAGVTRRELECWLADRLRTLQRAGIGPRNPDFGIMTAIAAGMGITVDVDHRTRRVGISLMPSM